MGLVTEVKKEDIFKRKTTVSNPWLDPAFNKVESLGGEPGFKVDDIPERLGLVQQGFDSASPTYYFTDLEDAPSGYGTKGQFLQTDGESKLSWAWPYWIKAGSNIYYKKGKVAIGVSSPRTDLDVAGSIASRDLTLGSIPFIVADSIFGQDNTNFTWDNTSKIFKVIGNTFLDGAVVINDSNADKDFRVEGSGATYTHLLFTDAGSNMVGINEDAPKALAHIRLSTCADYAGVHPYTALLVEGSSYVAIQLQGSATTAANIVFADDNYNPPAGRIQYNFNAGEMNFGIEGTIYVWFKTTGAVFIQHEMEVDSPTGYAAFIANAHNADAYFSLEEDEAIKWSMGYDYSDSLKFQISEGIPGTSVRFEIEPGVDGLINLYQDVGIRNSQDLRFYDNGNYVGFKAVGLIADQIWILPAADADAANKCLQSDAAGNLSWSQALGTADTPTFASLLLASMKSGATQAAAGAAANELWYTVSHATLPDYVVMMGV